MSEYHSLNETYQKIRRIEKRADLWAAHAGASGLIFFMLEILHQPTVFFSELSLDQRHTIFLSVLTILVVSNIGIVNSHIQAGRYRRKSGINYFYDLINFSERELAVPECELAQQTSIACDFLERYEDLSLRHYHFFMKKLQFAEELYALPEREDEEKRIFISDYVQTLKRNNE
jgi:hypothetical protein